VRGQFLTEDEEQQAKDNDERDAALAAFGLRLERESSEPAAPPVFELWPEHVAPFGLWCSGQSCLRHDMAGPSGLDHDALAALQRRAHLVRLPSSPRLRGQVWRDLHTIEVAALREWRAVRAEQK
jgi:hypothetical protein